MKRPSAALVVACLALAISLSGISYAAVTLKRNSVGTVQLKANAVTSKQVKNGTLQKVDFKASALPATLLSRTGSIPAGLTIRGAYGIQAPTSGTARQGVSFGFQLASAPVVHYINNGALPPADCPGTPSNPQANPGHLCIYEDQLGAGVTNTCVLPGNGNVCGNASRWGFVFSATATTTAQIWGTWAVTSP